MTSVADSLRSSTINITNISRSLFDTKRSISSVNDSVSNISKIIEKNTRIKRELFTTSEIIGVRRREASKRQELEDQIESSKVSTTPSKGLDFAGRSDKGPLGRLLGFLGFMTAGWIVENLPTWIFMGQEFISRIQIFGKSMYNMIDNMKLTLKSFGKLLTTSFDSIVKLDFNEFTDGSVAQSFDELNLAVQNVGGDITETFRLFTTPLNKSIETGEEAPGLGEMRPDTMFPGVGQEVTGIHKQALDLIARNESRGNYNAMNRGQSGDSPEGPKRYFGKNLTDMSIGEIKKLQKQGKINAAGRYQIVGISLPTAQTAAGLKDTDKFDKNNQDLLAIGLLKTQGPGAWTPYSKYSKEEISILYKAKDTPLVKSQPPSSTTSTQVKPAPIVVTSGFGWRWGRQHQGIDIAPKTGKVEGTPVIIRKGGTVVYANIGRGNMGQVLITHEDGTQSRYLHVNNFRVKAGQKVSAGQTIAHLAALGAPGIGNATGPHLHFEYYSSTSAPPSNPAGVYQNYVSLGGKVMGSPPKPLDPNQQPRTPDSAQITSPSRAAQPAAMTPDRKGSSVIFIDDTQPQISQASYPPQQSSVSPTINEFKVLNNFIKNKLLLELAYL